MGLGADERLLRSCRYFEIQDDAPYQFFLSQYSGKEPQKGVGMIPKRSCDVRLRAPLFLLATYLPTAAPALTAPLVSTPTACRALLPTVATSVCTFDSMQGSSVASSREAVTALACTQRIVQMRHTVASALGVQVRDFALCGAVRGGHHAGLVHGPP